MKAVTAKKYSLQWFCFITLAMLCTTGNAQVVFQFMPAVNGQTVNGLLSAQLQNLSENSFTGLIKITVRDGGDRVVLVLQTPVTAIKPGNHLMNAMAVQSRIQFGTGTAAVVSRQTGRFPEGEYDYCFAFTGTENKVNTSEQVFENCFNWQLLPAIPLRLINPDDGDVSCNLRPDLSWQPGEPYTSGLHYRLLLVEKQQGQDPADALLNNLPVIQQDNIAGCILGYPPQLPALQKARTYVWQVFAYLGSNRLTQSEVWSFNTLCTTEKIDSTKESYRQLSNLLNGNFYLALGVLRFSLSNPSNTRQLEYTVTDLSDAARKIDNLPVLQIKPGLNKIDIDLADIRGLETGKSYLLKIKNIGAPGYLRFIYKSNDK